MPPKKKKKSQTDINLSGPSSNPANNDETDQTPNETGTYETIIKNMFILHVLAL